jgi:cytochrome c biogenesis protein CcmG, thiol:disulfide interchange protein DsbE
METNGVMTDDSDNTAQLEQKLQQPKSSRKRRIIIFSVVSVINAGLLILLWTQLLTPAPNAGNGDNSVVDPLKGHRPPNFTLAALSTKSGSMVNLASFKGKAIVLNFWGATCVPCQDEAPMLQKEWQHAQSQGVVFIGVDFQDVQSDGLSFLQKYGITYPNALDTSGSIAINYGVTYTPTTYFINKQGVVVSSIPREMTATELQNGIKSLI